MSSASLTRQRIEAREDERREAANRRRCPITCAAEALLIAALDSGQVVQAARERVEHAAWTLSEMAREGKELQPAAAESLVEYLLTITLAALD